MSRGAVGDLLTIAFHVPAEPAHSHRRAVCFVNTQMLLLLLMHIWIFMSLKGSIQRLIRYFSPPLPLQSSPMKAPNVAKKQSFLITWLEANGERCFIPLLCLCFYFEILELELRRGGRKLLWRQTSGNTTDDVDGTVQQGPTCGSITWLQTVERQTWVAVKGRKDELPDCIWRGWQLMWAAEPSDSPTVKQGG